MRKALNDNPIAQIGLLAGLALIVGFLLMTRMGGSSTEPPPASSASTETVVPSTTDPTTAPESVPSTTASPAAGSPSAAVPTSTFEAGPGLPAAVVDAYEANDAVVLLVTKRNGIDDQDVLRAVNGLHGEVDVAVFSTLAKDVARYSRIAEGVNVDRAPAMVVIRPKSLSDSTMPEATVAYGFRSDASVQQAVQDALYKGNTNLPFYPR
jgi:hypothetical protein